MSVLQLHRPTVAACGNPPAILSVPGDRWLWGASGCAGEGDILPYVRHQVDWRLREQWAHCGSERKIILCIHLEGSFVWARSSADSPPTFRVTVPVAVPAELLATQVYWPASTSCTPRMRRVPWGTSRPANGVEPTSNSPGSIRRSYRCALLLSVFCIKRIVTLTYL